MFKTFIKQTPFGISILLFSLTAGLIILIAPVGGQKALIVRSGSMQPTINVGDLIRVKPQQNYNVGDIIAFRDIAKSSITVTHRITAVKSQNGQTYYQTKGDANEEADFSLIPQQNILGRAEYGIKGIGKLFAFSKTRQGFLTLAAIPAAFVIILEALNIIKEVKKSKNKTQKNFHYGKPMGVSRSRTLLPFLATLLITNNTFSFFSDTETSTGNVFTAAESFCNSTEGNVVINEVFYNVDTAHNGQGSENNWEWVELYNPTSTVKDITGWKIADSNQTDNLPAGTITIEPCSFAIVSPVSQSEFTDQSNDGGRWTIPEGVVFINLGSFIGNGLPAGGDAVILKDGSNNEIDAMSYGTNTSKLNPAVPAVSSGHSSERDPDGTDTNIATDFVDRTIPTPGS